MNDVEMSELQKNFFDELKKTHVMYVKQQISLLNALEQEFGNKVIKIVEKVSAELIVEDFKKYSDGNETISGILCKLWEPLKAKGYEYSTQQTKGKALINCTKCPLASLYTSLGGEKWGYHLYCSADNKLTKYFNSKITFKRDKTLMEGDDCCNHFYDINN